MTLKQIQKKLLNQCLEIVKRCKGRTELITKGYVHRQVASGAMASTGLVPDQQTQQQSQGTYTFHVTVEGTLTEDIQGIIALAQNELVQEWHGYLDAVFVEALRQCLGKREFQSRLPKMKVELPDLIWNRKTDMVESVCKSLEEPFSFCNYPEKILILTALFNVESDDGIEFEVKKHVMIRNVLQHNHGVIRSIDLKRIGREGQNVSVLEQNRKVCKFGLGDKIELSVAEIENLVNVMKDYSLYFEKLQ